MPWSVRPSRVKRPTGADRYVSSLTRLPAEAANCGKQADHAPDEDGCERLAGLPEMLMLDHHVPRHLREIGERQDVGDGLEEARVLVRREERSRDDCHRQVDEV